MGDSSIGVGGGAESEPELDVSARVPTLSDVVLPDVVDAAALVSVTSCDALVASPSPHAIASTTASAAWTAGVGGTDRVLVPHDMASHMRASSHASHSPSCWRSSSVGVGLPAGGMSSFVAAGPDAAFQSM